MSTMHIAFLIGQLGSGGSERQVYLIARELRSRGEHVTVFTCHSGGFWHQPLIDGGVPVVVIPWHRSLDWQRLLRLREELTAHAVDLLLCFGSAEAFYGRLACLGLPTRAVACLRNQSWYGFRGLWADRLLKRVTASYVANSQAGRHYLQHRVGVPSDQVWVIPNAVDRKAILDAGASMVDPRPQEAPKDAIWCAWVGALVWRKDPVLLVRVASLACASEARLQILVVGDGPLHTDLQKSLVEDGLGGRVHLIGAIEKGSDIWRYVDFGLSTSRVEGTPNVVLEAMTWGKPYVAPPVGDCTHLVSHGENGLLARSRSAEDLADLVVRLVQDAELRRGLSVNAKETAKEFPSPAQVADQYLSLARSLIQEVKPV